MEMAIHFASALVQTLRYCLICTACKARGPSASSPNTAIMLWQVFYTPLFNGSLEWSSQEEADKTAAQLTKEKTNG